MFQHMAHVDAIVPMVWQFRRLDNAMRNLEVELLFRNFDRLFPSLQSVDLPTSLLGCMHKVSSRRSNIEHGTSIGQLHFYSVESLPKLFDKLVSRNCKLFASVVVGIDVVVGLVNASYFFL